MSIPNPSTPSTLLFLSGKVIVDDGAVLTDPAAIQTVCRGNTRTVGYTDRKGTFSIELDPNSSATLAGVGDVTDTGPTMQNDYGGTFQMRDFRDCQVQAVLPGFTSQVVDLSPRLGGDSRADLGNIVLHRIGEVQGFTISATSAAAPSKARKDYEKGLSLAKKQSWAEAQQKFQSAVDIYPKYAVAWVELGRMQLRQSHEDDAKRSLQKALAADERFIPVYEELVEIAVSHQQWKDVAEQTDQLLRLNPVNFPQYWFLNAVANYQLQNFDAAEKSAARGLQLDPKHHIPKMELVLGLALEQQHDYHGALEHLRNYVQAAPKSEDTEMAQAQISKLEAQQAATTPPETK
jgi:tetratricopeptide (TPR) repeat protein